MANRFVEASVDPRTDEKPDGELAIYAEYLTNYRLTLDLKCQDLSPEQLAARSVPPSTMSLLGLVRHLAQVEHNWFQRGLQGRFSEQRPFWSDDDPDWDFTGAEPTAAGVEEAFASWREQITRADAYLRQLTVDGLATRVTYNREGEVTSVRDIVVHMIEEYARHCGHADLLRECIDGRTGQ